MSGSIIGKNIQLSTWGESHGKALGVVVDGFPAGMELNEEDIQKFLDRGKTADYAAIGVGQIKKDGCSGIGDL